ncbi:MAG: 1-deoxy-D-xylulose-5-phosphate synthase [Firmicutes bacterium]|nr:1-deoxy-D-xylulose-5-phosphate synthase [Alicyclobacillaceae bacterium]MCL6496681.1 1-deoxy-D-xylulose-5-phosphate synthase [Bacillota bacterium]
MLERIDAPQDLKALSLEQLEALAQEIRASIIETTAKSGGHVGASLGTVELTLALHRVFDSPQDKLVWDIGHQAYAHKLVTGRRDRFGTLRQLGGLSGFLKRAESPHDVWEAGHAATSLSAALGMAVARDLQGQHHHVVAIIGDGALTAGMAWEALNQAGHLKTRLLVVVNDNSMSIAPNVGAFSRYLTDLRSAPAYARLKQEVEQLLESVPVVGGRLARTVERLKDLVRYALVSGNVFEDLGFRYFGPLDGHNLADLIAVLSNARAVDGPVVVHVVTQKGRGYPPAERQPDRFHGPGPFEVQSGRILTDAAAPPSYSQVAAETLVELAREHPEIVAITAAMPDGTKLDLFAKAFPDRFFDVGIAEQHAATFAAGLAASGLRPVFAVYSTFLQRAYDQVIHDVCHQNLPVLFAIDRAGLVGADGATHQGIFDLAFLRPIPHLEIAMGKDENELRGLLAAAITRPGPVAIRYPRGNGRGLAWDGRLEPIPWGKAEWIRRGEDVTLIGFGPIVYQALKAADLLAAAGWRVGVINARFLKPLDTEALAEAARTSRLLVTVEEHVAAGGFGSAVLEWAAQRGDTPPVVVLGLPEAFIDHGPVDHYLALYGLSGERIAERVEAWLGRMSSAAR